MSVVLIVLLIILIVIFWKLNCDHTENYEGGGYYSPEYNVDCIRGVTSCRMSNGDEGICGINGYCFPSFSQNHATSIDLNRTHTMMHTRTSKRTARPVQEKRLWW